MDTVRLVENQIDEGQWLLDQLEKGGIVVRAACWLKPVAEDRWSLYIATPIVDDMGPLGAYRQVTPALRSLGYDWITGSDIMLVGEEHPIIGDAFEILRRFPHDKPIRSPRSLVGGISVEEVFVYPLGKTFVTIYSLEFPDAPDDMARMLSLHEFSTVRCLSVDGKEYKGMNGNDLRVIAPQGAKLEQVSSKQMVLEWELRGTRKQSSANEVWSLANLGLYGFRFLRQPNLTLSST